MFKYVERIINNETIKFYTLENNEIVISTRDICKLTGSRHSNTLRSIRTLYIHCENEDMTEGLVYLPWSYKDECNRTNPCILINFELYTLHVGQQVGTKYRKEMMELTNVFKILDNQ